MPQFHERSCDNCRRLKIRCDRMKPQCKNCFKRGVSCTRNKPLQKRGPKPKPFNKTKNKRNKIIYLENNSVDSVEYNDLYFNVEPTYVEPEYPSESLLSENSLPEVLSEDSDSIIYRHQEKDDIVEYSEIKSEVESVIPSTPDLILSSTSTFEPTRTEINLDKEVSYYNDTPLSTIDVNTILNTYYIHDMGEFSKQLVMLSPNIVEVPQLELVLYYYTTIHPYFPILSRNRFLSLLNQPYDINLLKALVATLCKISSYYAAKPKAFQKTITSFVFQFNLDLLANTPITNPNYIGLLLNTYTILLRVHTSTTIIN